MIMTSPMSMVLTEPVVRPPTSVHARLRRALAGCSALDVQLLGHVVLLAWLFRTFWLVPERLGSLSCEAYFYEVLALQWISNPAAAWTLGVWSLIAALGWKRLAWRRLEDGSHL